ncbi:MAG: class I SAM-dependent methyltransferase [Bacteroidota bacterium]|jgi:SAM-dependent methyltransferase
MKSYIKQFSERPQYLSERLYFERFHGASKGPILEIGCSVGHHTQFGADRKIGIDYDLDALKIARGKGFTVAQVDVQPGLPFKDASFTSIDCQHVIEHVENPLFLMKECLRVLKPGGRAVVVTPNVRAVGFEFYIDYTHIRPFTSTSLERIAYDAGFSTYSVLYSYTGIPLTKLLNQRGLLSIEGALKTQSFFYSLGVKVKETLVLVAEK